MSSTRTKPVILATVLTVSFLTLTGCSTTDTDGLIPLTQSPDDTLYAWETGEDRPTLEGTEGTWTLKESGYENLELGCTLTPTILQSPSETGKDEAETAILLDGVANEVTNWKQGEPIVVPVPSTGAGLELATATYQKEGGEQNEMFLAARYLVQTGQILMAIVACDSPDGYQFASQENGFSDIGLTLTTNQP